MKCIAYTRPDGGVSVVHPHEGNRLARSVEKDGAVIILDPPGPVDSVFRVWPVEGGANVEWAETEDEFVARRASTDVPADATNPQVIEPSELPDRTFRNAWKHDGDKVDVDMPKAREIHKDNLRLLRAPKLAALDIEYQRADERGDVARKVEIAVQKQALRDVTNAAGIDAAQTPEELKAAIPDALKG